MAKDFNLDDLPDLPGGTAVDELPDLPVENVPRLGTIPRSNDLPSLLRNPRLGRSPMVPAVPSRLHAVLAGAAPDQPIAALPDDGLQARLPGPSRGDSYLARATGQPDPLEAIGEGPGSAIPLGPEASERLKALRPDLVAQSQPTNLQFAGSALMGAALSIPRAVYDLGYGGLGLTHALGLTSDADLAEAARSRRDFSAGLDELTGTGSGSANPGKNIMDLGSGLLPFALPVVGTALGAAGMAGTGEAEAIEAGATRGQAALAALFEGTAGAVLPKIGKMAAPALEAASSRIGDALAQQVMRETASPVAAKIAAETVAKGLEGAAHGELANTLLAGAGAAGQSAYDPEGAQARLKAGMGDPTLALLGALPGAARGLVAPDGVNLAPAYTSREMAPGGPYDRLRTADADLARVQRDIPDTHPADQAITPATEVAGTKGLGPADEATLAHRDTFTPMAEAAELPDMPARTGGQLREAPIADAKAVQAQIDAEDAAFEKAMKTRRNDTNAGETQALGELDTGAFEPVRPPEPDTAQKFNTAPLSTDTGLHRAGFITPDEADARKAAERAGGADETRVSEPIRPGATDDANAAALPDQRLHPEQPRPAAGGDQPLEVAGDDGSRAGPGGGRDEGGAEAAQQPGRDGAAASPEAAPFHPAIRAAIDQRGVTPEELGRRASSKTNDTLGEALAKYPVGDDPHGAMGNAQMIIDGSRRFAQKQAATKPKETANVPTESRPAVQPTESPAEGQADVPQAGRQEEAAAAAQPGEGARPAADVKRPPVKAGKIAEHDILDEIRDAGGIVAKGRGEFAAGENDDRRGMPLAHTSVISGSERADNMARHLKEMGYGDGTTQTMWKMIKAASDQRLQRKKYEAQREGPGYTTQERDAITGEHPGEEDASFDFGEKPPEEPPVKPGQQEIPEAKERPEQQPGGQKQDERANPGKSGAEQHMIDQEREKVGPPEERKHAPLIEAAKKAVADDVDAVHRRLMDKHEAGEAFTDQDVKDAQEASNALYEKGRVKEAQELARAYVVDGTGTAQALSARQVHTPGARQQIARIHAMAPAARSSRETEALKNQIRDLLAQKAKLEAGGPSQRRQRVQSAKKTAMKELADLGRQLHRVLTKDGSAGALGGESIDIMGKMLTKAVKVAGLSVADAVLFITDHVPAFRHDPAMHKQLEEVKAQFLKDNPGIEDPGSVADLVAKDAQARAEKRAAATVKRYENLEAYHKKLADDLAAMTPEERQRYIQGEAAAAELPKEAQDVVAQHRANIKDLKEQIDQLTVDTDKQVQDEQKSIDKTIADREAENQKLAAMSEAERKTYYAKRLEANKVPEKIEQIRANSKAYLKMLAERKAELLKGAKSKLPEVRSISEQIAAEQQRIDAQVAGWKARRDALANQTYEQRQAAKQSRQPDPILKGMRDDARRQHSDLLKQIRDLNNPQPTKVDSPEARAIDRKLEAAQKRIDDLQQKDLDHFERVIKPHLKRSGFDLDSAAQPWTKTKEGLEGFMHALAAARGDWTDVYKFWVTAAMHGLAAPFKKLVSDPIMIGADKLVLRPLEAAFNKLGGRADGASFKEAGMAIQGLIPAFVRAVAEFGPAYGHQGYRDTKAVTEDYGHYPTVNGPIGNAISHLATLHLVKAMDVSAKTLSTLADVASFAHRTAVDATGKRLTGEDYQNHLRSELENRDSKSWNMAWDRARKDTFTDPVKGLAWLNRIKNSHPETLGGKMLKVGAITVAPFTTIPGNIMKHGLFNGVPMVSDALTVIKALARRHDGNYDRNSLNRDLAKATARWVGYGLLSAINAKTGFLTGGDDKDHPNSINLFGHHFSFQHLGPISWLLSSAADMSTAKDGRKVAALWDGISRRVTDESVLRSIGDLNEARKAQDGWLKYGAKTASSILYPAVFRQLGGAYNYAVNQERPRKTLYQPGETAKGNPAQRLMAYMLENADIPGFYAKPWKNPDGSSMKPEAFGFKPADFLWQLISPMRMGKGLPGAKLNSLPAQAAK